MTATKGATRSLYLPALFCEMGNWKYYATAMRLGDVAERISYAKSVRVPRPNYYDEWMQREVDDKRKLTITDYLSNQPERFFSSLVVTVNGGQPKWLDLGLLDSDQLSLEDLPPLMLESIERSLGLLYLSGNEVLFPIDGQHRLAGIKEAVRENPALGNETVSVLFVADRGRVETRRLFSTLNRYAHPVTQGERIVLDEDDAMAISTRRLVLEHPIFATGSVAPPKRYSLSDTDTKSFTTAVTLYTVNTILCTKYHRGSFWTKKYLTGSYRPKEEQLQEIYGIVGGFWDLVAKHFPAVRALKNKPSGSVVPEHRRIDGGDLLFRPAGQMAFARAVRMLHDREIPIADAVKALADVPLQLERKPWTGLLWQPLPEENRGRMIATVEAQKATAGLFLLSAGFITTADERASLRAQYRKAVGDPNARLPSL